MELLAVGILKGAWVFMADMARRITVPVLCDFMGISSYEDRAETAGVVRITSDLSLNIKDRYVLLVEDISHTGTSLTWRSSPRVSQAYGATDPAPSAAPRTRWP